MTGRAEKWLTEHEMRRRDTTKSAGNLRRHSPAGLLRAMVALLVIANTINLGADLGAMAAALKGSQQIGFTIISLTVSLIAALIPLLFMGEIVGRLFHEFAITLAVTSFNFLGDGLRDALDARMDLP